MLDVEGELTAPPVRQRHLSDRPCLLLPYPARCEQLEQFTEHFPRPRTDLRQLQQHLAGDVEVGAHEKSDKPTTAVGLVVRRHVGTLVDGIDGTDEVGLVEACLRQDLGALVDENLAGPPRPSGRTSPAKASQSVDDFFRGVLGAFGGHQAIEAGDAGVGLADQDREEQEAVLLAPAAGGDGLERRSPGGESGAVEEEDRGVGVGHPGVDLGAPAVLVQGLLVDLDVLFVVESVADRVEVLPGLLGPGVVAEEDRGGRHPEGSSCRGQGGSMFPQRWSPCNRVLRRDRAPMG